MVYTEERGRRFLKISIVVKEMHLLSALVSVSQEPLRRVHLIIVLPLINYSVIPCDIPLPDSSHVTDAH